MTFDQIWEQFLQRPDAPLRGMNLKDQKALKELIGHLMTAKEQQEIQTKSQPHVHVEVKGCDDKLYVMLLEKLTQIEAKIGSGSVVYQNPNISAQPKGDTVAPQLELRSEVFQFSGKTNIDDVHVRSGDIENVDASVEELRNLLKDKEEEE